MQENKIFKHLLSGEDRSKDGRLKEVAKLLTQVPTVPGGANVRVPQECYDELWATRRALVESAVAAARAVVEYDEHLARFYSERCADDSQNRGLGAAVRAAAQKVVYASDWVALLMLCKEKGIDLTEAQLVEIVAHEVPRAPRPTRQGLEQARWDTGRKRFPNWEPTGCRFDKFRRHCAVAAAAMEMLRVM